MDYQAKLSAPFGMLGIRCDDEALLGIDFLPATDKPQRATSPFAERVCEQLRRYFENPDAQFSIPLRLTATPHQQKVWQAMLNIPRGCTRTYGELAAELHSSAQAVGQACGANPVPIIIPCHRVVGRAGLGGFIQSTGDTQLDIKRWLLSHESTNPSPPAPLPKGARGEPKTPSPLQGEGWGEVRNTETRSTIIVKVK
ncbi:MAG: methylated-DNA--[protein]-cysteine S-methyltransferase [Gallionella sp.]|nr:methylated-DNA--[protein]-cysteine S-methyltransferase [Gallionella sp.]